MAAGLPVLHPHGGIPEIVDDEVTGLLWLKGTSTRLLRLMYRTHAITTWPGEWGTRSPEVSATLILTYGTTYCGTDPNLVGAQRRRDRPLSAKYLEVSNEVGRLRLG